MNSAHKQRRSNEWIVVGGKYEDVEFVDCILESRADTAAHFVRCTLRNCDLVGPWPSWMPVTFPQARLNPLHEPEVVGIPDLPVTPPARPRKWWPW